LASLLALGLTVSPGCTAVLDWDTCESNTDCPADNPVCDTEAGVCVGGSGTGPGPGPGLTTDQLLDNGCYKVSGVPLSEALDPDVVLVATLLPISGPLGAVGPSMDNAVVMAAQEMNGIGGLGGSTKLAVLSCDSGSDTAPAAIAAEHIVKAGVKAVIGPARSAVVIDAFNSIFKAAEVLTITPSGTAPALSDLADDNLVWRTCPSDAFQGAAMAGYLKDSGASKVALVNIDDAYGNGLAQNVRDGLCAPAGPLNCTDDDVFFNRKYGEATYPTVHPQIVLDLEAFQPDITVLIGLNEDGKNFLTLVEQTTISRRFVVSDGLKDGGLVNELEAELVCRTVGTQPAAPSGSNYQNFELGYRGSFDGDQAGAFSANSYDAMYLLGYAYAAAGIDADGPALAAALGRVSSGDTVNVGLTDFLSATQRLSSSSTTTINFEGASGPLDFTAKGEAPASIEMWAFDVDDSETNTLGEVFSADGIYNAPVISDPSVPGQGAACVPFRSAP